MSAAAVGIDLGTTFSVVAHLDAMGRPVSVPNADGDLTTPSVVFLDPAGAIVGKEALKAAEFDPDRAAAFPKRDMGRPLFHKPVRGEHLPPEVLQAVILRKLKLDAEQKLGPLTNAVITVPAYFNEPRRKLTQDAGRMAGWNVLAILNEPTAAAIAYGVGRGFLSPERGDHAPEMILVYDLGGGTFDVTLMSVEANSFTALATAGDVELGGIDWDARLAGHIADRFKAEFGIDPLDDAVASAQLRREAEDAKRALTARSEVTVAFAHAGKRLRLPVSRREFEDLSGDLLDRTLMTLRKLMRDAGKSYADLTRLLVVGGSTRMPMVAAMLEKETGRAVDRELSADEAVAHGAALYADMLTRGNAAFRVRNVSSHDLGIIAFDRKTKAQRRRVMIPRNTPLPASADARFPMMKDNQRSVMVNVIEGGDSTGKHASAVGKCLVQNLPPFLLKSTAVEVSFAYTEQGRLEVRAAIPSVNLQAETVIERAVGVPELQLAAWTEVVRAGLPDHYSRPGSEAEVDREGWDVELIED